MSWFINNFCRSYAHFGTIFFLRGVGRWARKPVNHTSWVAVVTPTDRPKSVRNCCLIELFCGVLCVATLPLWHFCCYRGFCHRTGSDLLLFVLESWKYAVFCTFSYMLLTVCWNFVYDLIFLYLRSRWSIVDLRQFFFRSYASFGTWNTWNAQFPHFSPSCFDLWSWNFVYDFLFMSYSTNQVECCSFGSIFVRVMPLSKLRILKTHSFLHFSPTCFDIFSWTLVYNFLFINLRSSSSVVILRQFYYELFFFSNLTINICTSFLLHTLAYWAEILHMTFFLSIRVSTVLLFHMIYEFTS